jgi:hypothetical protein
MPDCLASSCVSPSQSENVIRSPAVSCPPELGTISTSSCGPMARTAHLTNVLSRPVTCTAISGILPPVSRRSGLSSNSVTGICPPRLSWLSLAFAGFRYCFRDHSTCFPTRRFAYIRKDMLPFQSVCELAGKLTVGTDLPLKSVWVVRNMRTGNLSLHRNNRYCAATEASGTSRHLPLIGAFNENMRNRATR